ncbi:hypothetical protein Hypma_004767 [Hypsizygus marmoreus]|uniref:Protein kinase domain-containing protein n=1 Tax=Hypsizygus marmoreus TaxID=39966 RepID=A0A369J1H1_HYPMA|nr:hypothetical protein Hypma_004767 [Hypsizygus marmoreus]
MTSKMTRLQLNVWAVGIDAPIILVPLPVDPDTNPFHFRPLIAAQLGWSAYKFDLYRPSQCIMLPDDPSQEDLKTMQQRWGSDLSLWRFPKNRNDRLPLANNKELHLVAVERGAYQIYIYDTRTREVSSHQLSFTTYIREICVSPFKPPERYRWVTPSICKATLERLQSIDPTSLSEIPCIKTLRDLYPLGVPHEIHLIDVPEDGDEELEKEDMLSPLNVTEKRRRHFETVPQKAPSSEAKGTSLASVFNQQLVGRSPESVNAAPPSLFDETLCKLRHNIHHLDPSPDDYTAFHKLRSAMVVTYSDESARKKAFYHIVPEFLPGSPREIDIYEFRTDGALLVDHEKQSYIYVIIEVQNEVGLASAEPGIQGARYYLEHVRSLIEAQGEKLGHCALPVILLCQFGPYLSVSVGSAGGPSPVPTVEQVAFIALHADVTYLAETKAGACIIGALRAASLSLRNLYPSLIKDTKRQVQFPYPRSFRDMNGEMVSFTYVRAEENKRVYHAKRDDTADPICIKFSLRYSSKAHEVAYEAGYAPRLLAVERAGDWNMIVMDDESDDYFTLVDLRESGGVSDRIENVRDEVRRALGIVHDQGYVHGDIRAINVLVRKTDAATGPGSVLLIDWDWAGRDGDVRYPYSINPEIARPEGAVAGSLISRDHDLWMIRTF